MRFKKKGSMLDNFWVAISLFGLALFMIVVSLAWGYFTTSDMDDKFWDKNPTSANIKQDGQDAFDNMDMMFTLVYFGTHLGILALAYLLRNHPIMYIGVLLLAAFLVVIAAPLSNVWNEIVSDPEFASVILNYPRTDWIMDNFPLFEMIWAFLTAVVLIGVARMD